MMLRLLRSNGLQRAAVGLTVLSLGLLPVLAWFAWPRGSLLVMCALLAVPLSSALAAFSFERLVVLRWLGFLANLSVALVMAAAFAYMVAHVSPPPNLVQTLPVLLAALVLLATPLANVMALYPLRR